MNKEIKKHLQIKIVDGNNIITIDNSQSYIELNINGSKTFAPSYSIYNAIINSMVGMVDPLTKTPLFR